jgi:3D (Asp-Asp-Asp) domain-containing protein
LAFKSATSSFLQGTSGAIAGAVDTVVDAATDAVTPGSGVKKQAKDLGQFVTTAYGPPWEGVQGTGVTANGANLRSNPHIYGVAVDPTVIKLGSNLLIWPNPFGYKGTFVAFDTGGAIKGKRIDFYDWRGRAQQNSWGRRTVKVAQTDRSQTTGANAGSALNPGAAVNAGISAGASVTQGWGALIELVRVVLSPKGLGTLLARVWVFFLKLVWRAMWDVLFAPPWHWTQRAVDYYFNSIMSAKAGSGFYYKSAGIITVLFWSLGYGVLWGKAENGPGLASNARESMFGRTVRSGQNVAASRKVTKPKNVEKETATKPQPAASKVPVGITRTIKVARRRPVSVRATGDTTNVNDTSADSQPDTESTESS